MSIRGYKVFNSDWTCRGFKYEVGKTYEHKGDISICKKGFHFCRKIADCFSYYDFNPQNKVAEIEAIGFVESDGKKSVTNEIKILREISWEEMLKLANEGHNNTGIRNTGNWNTGNRNTGNWNTGNWNTGNWNTGNRNTGDWNTGNWNTGDWNTGFFNIRKLTPRECWRLQSFSDDEFDKAQFVNSDSQLYKQAGNSVTVNVVYDIAKAIGETYENKRDT